MSTEHKSNKQNEGELKMAESKPTKLQMAKEIQYLIAAAQDMSAVMDLDPPIKTDYLIDLKNKTVTVSHLNHVIGSLQADMKAVAVEIEPEDKFQPDTHRVLADLNVKVPRPSAKEEVVEEQVEVEAEEKEVAYDDLKKTDETEEEKPIKKAVTKKSSNVEKSPHGYRLDTQAGRIDVAIDGKLTVEQLAAAAGVSKSRVSSHLGGLRSVKKLTVEIDDETKAVIVS